MRQRMARQVDSEGIEDNLVRAAYYVQQKTPIPITEEFRYSTFLEILKEHNAEQEREKKASKKSGLGR